MQRPFFVTKAIMSYYFVPVLWRRIYILENGNDATITQHHCTKFLPPEELHTHMSTIGSPDERKYWTTLACQPVHSGVRVKMTRAKVLKETALQHTNVSADSLKPMREYLAWTKTRESKKKSTVQQQTSQFTQADMLISKLDFGENEHEQVTNAWPA